MNKKIYIYKIIFIAFFILILLDMSGCVKNFEAFIFVFFAILFIIHGIYMMNIISVINKGLCMIINWFKKVFKKCISLFCKNKTERNKKKVINKLVKLETKQTSSIKKNTIAVKKKTTKK